MEAAASREEGGPIASEDGGGDRNDAPERAPIRPFWSGTISFGLVSIPVDLYAGARSRRASLRMLAPDGTPLRRRYVCPEDEEEVEAEHIVRGHETDDGWVVVTDEELDALEPEKSRDIDLRRFVPRADLDPLFFVRAYYLAPATDSTKAYRLLARAMEEEDRAGIARFVMRGREYLVAILAENGILRAETLRFHDEVRSPWDVGLPEPPEEEPGPTSAVRKAIEGLAGEEVPEEALRDRWSARLRARVEEKRAAEDDVVRVSAEAAAGEAEAGTGVIDLMEVLRRRMGGRPSGEEADEAARVEAGGGDGDAGAEAADEAGGGAGAEELRERTKQELYERAKRLDIRGRSGMTKEELIAAIRRAS